MNYFTAYLFTQIESLGSLAGYIFGWGLALLLVMLVFKIINYAQDDDVKEPAIDIFTRRPIKILIWTLPITLFLNFFIPTQKEVAFIVIAPAIVNNKDVQKTLKQIPELSALGLEYLTETLKGEVKEATEAVKETVISK